MVTVYPEKMLNGTTMCYSFIIGHYDELGRQGLKTENGYGVSRK